MKIEHFNTERLILRKVTSEVMDYIFTVYNDEEQFNFLGLTDYKELEAQKRKWEIGLATHNRKLLYFFMLEKESKKVIGWCGYHTWYTDHNRAEIGYGVFQDAEKRKGYMTEALEYIINFGFKQMNLHRIEAMASPSNVPSLRLLDKFKFEKEGYLKEHYLTEGVYEDSLVFSLLKK